MAPLRAHQQVATMVGVLLTAAPAAMATVPEQTAAPPRHEIASPEGPGSLRVPGSLGVPGSPGAPVSLRAELELPRTAAPPAPSFAGRPRGALPEAAAAGVADAPTAAEQRLAGALQIAWPRPALVAAVANSRSQGSPTVHLWENSHALLTIGLNRHGNPGIYMLHKVP